MQLISVIIPYYKKKKFIKRAIDSVLNQSYKNFEVIIVYDDNNKDDLIYLKQLCYNSNKISLIINEHNLGAGFSRNKGIKFSNGNFIAFLDADDHWHSAKLETQVKMMTDEVLISHTDYLIIDEKDQILGKRISKELSYDDLLKSCDIGLSTVMVKKSLLNLDILFPNLNTKEDYALWLEITKKFSCKIYPLNKVLTYWTDCRDSLSKNLIQKIRDAFIVYYKYCNKSLIISFFYLLRLSINFLRKK